MPSSIMLSPVTFSAKIPSVLLSRLGAINFSIFSSTDTGEPAGIRPNRGISGFVWGWHNLCARGVSFILRALDERSKYPCELVTGYDRQHRL
jgi:hypothetical protein